MQTSREFSISTKLHIDLLVQTQAHQVQRFVHRAFIGNRSVNSSHPVLCVSLDVSRVLRRLLVFLYLFVSHIVQQPMTSMHDIRIKNQTHISRTDQPENEFSIQESTHHALCTRSPVENQTCECGFVGGSHPEVRFGGPASGSSERLFFLVGCVLFCLGRKRARFAGRLAVWLRRGPLVKKIAFAGVSQLWTQLPCHSATVRHEHCSPRILSITACKIPTYSPTDFYHTIFISNNGSYCSRTLRAPLHARWRHGPVPGL
jgi:hypothetical protein